MVQCEKCGFQLPNYAEYCPNCGIPVKLNGKESVSTIGNIGRIIQAGVFGAFISVLISSLSPKGIDLFFLPSFLSSLVAVYLIKVRRIDEAITVSLAVYLFSDGIIGGIFLGTLYYNNIPLANVYGSYIPTLIDVVMYVASPISAIIAGYLGNKLMPKEPVRKQTSYGYERKKDHGGIIYAIDTLLKKSFIKKSHKV